MSFFPATPILRIFDFEKAKAFYCDYLDFQVDFQFQFGEGMPRYLEVTRSDCRLGLSEHHGDGTPGTHIRIRCDDVQL